MKKLFVNVESNDYIRKVKYNFETYFMKKFLLVLMLTAFTAGLSYLHAQSAKEQPAASAQKGEDGILAAYPNPTKDVLIVKAKDPFVKIKSVSFYSILGTPVLTYNVNLNAAEISLERLRPGKYLMRYTLSDNTQKVRQIIKQ